MFTNSFPGGDVMFDSFLVLAAGGSGIVAIAWLATRWVRSATGQRAVWQMVLLALAGLVVGEVAGLSPFVAQWVSGEALRHKGTEALRGQEAGGGGQEAGVIGPKRLRLELEPLADVPPPEASVALSPITFSLGRETARQDVIVKTVEETQDLLAVATVADPKPPVATLVEERDVTDKEAEAVPSAWPRAIAPWLAGLWVVAAMVLAGRLLLGRVLLVRFSRRLGDVEDDALTWRLHSVARRLGMRRAIRLREANGLSAPVAWGIWRPTIVVPPGFAEDFAAEEQQAMLAHELAHLRGCDSAWQSLADWLAVVLWWHPLVWWSHARWRAAAEAAADEASLVVARGPELLAGCLVALGGRVSGTRPLGWVGMEGAGFRSSLGRRVSRLLSLTSETWRPPSGRWRWAKTFLPAAAVAVAIFSTTWARSEAAYRGEADMKTLKHYWRHSLLGAAVIFAAGCGEMSIGADDPAQVTPAVALPDGDDPGRGEEGERRRDPPREGGDKQPGETPFRFGPGEPGAADPPREREGDRPRRRDGDPPREGERRRDGDRPREGDRPRDGDRPREDERPRREGEGPRDGDRPREGDEGGGVDNDRRVRLLLAAAENLAAAGFPDRAAALRREAEDLRRRGGGDRPRREGDEFDGPRREGEDPGPRRRDREFDPFGGGRPPELIQSIRRLQVEVEKLRAEVAEMRAIIKRDRAREGDAGKEGAEVPNREREGERPDNAPERRR